MKTTETLLTPDDVASLLRVTRRWVIASNLPRVELGPRKIRYKACDVLEFAASKETRRTRTTE